MSTVAGAFDETLLMNFVVRADEVNADGRVKLQYMPNWDSLNAALQVTNARVLAPISASKKDFDVEVEWMNTCEMAVEDNTDCEFDGVKSSTNVKEYKLEHEKVVRFSVDEYDFRDNRVDTEESVAKQFLAADKALVEWLNQLTIARLETFSGVNEYDGDKGTVSGTDTFIPAAYWNADLMGYFHKISILNRFNSPILLNGHNLYTQNYLAAAKAGNANGAGDAVLFGTIPSYWDLFWMDAISDAQVSYLIQNGSIAFASKTYNPDTPQVVNGVFTRYTIDSKWVPGLKYDVFYEPECTTSDAVKHNFKVKVKADMFLNPTGCAATNTGVLRFVCGEGE